MQVRMEHAEPERVAQKIRDHVRAEYLGNETLRLKLGEPCLIVVLHHPQIGGDARPLQILHRQDALAAQVPIDFRQPLAGRARGVVAQDLGVGAFAAIVELVERPGGKLAHRIAHEVHAADAQEEDNLHAQSEQQIVALEYRADARALHLHGRRRAVLQRRPVDLADRRRGHRDVIELRVQLARRGAQRFHKHALHRIDREDLTRQLADTPEPFADVLRLALAVAPAERQITMAQIAERLA